MKNTLLMAESGRLAEEVTDCGPVIDLKATPGCQLVKDKADPKVNILSREIAIIF